MEASGVIDCPACKATWGTNTKAYPSVDLTPVASLANLKEARAEPIEEYERLRELVRPYLPPGAVGLKGGRASLRFRQRASPDLLELELHPVGRAHADCLPADRQPRCPRCGRFGLTLPKPLLLDAATLPSHLDVFRLEDFSTVIVCTERFVDACQRLGFDGVTFHPLLAR